MRIVIVPARGGSKRIRNKNIVEFCGKPMIGYALEAARGSGLFDKIHVSTDSQEIREVVEGLGFEIEFMRPGELGGDMTGIIPVLQWVLARYGEEGQAYEDVCCLFPVCPLLEAGDLVRGFEVYERHGRERPLHVVAPFPVPIEWAYRRDGEGRLTPVQPGGYAIRSQDLEGAYYECGPFSIFNRSHLLSDEPAGDEGFVSMVMERERAVDIDEPGDLVLAEALYRGRQLSR